MIPRLTPETTIQPVYRTYLDALARSGFTGDIDYSYSSRLAVATDNSVYQWLPQAVVRPKSTNDIVLLLTLANDPLYRDVVFSPRGGGTGTNGQSLSSGVIVDVSRHMTNLLALDVDARKVRVQAGLIKDKLNLLIKPYGLFFSPELSTSNRATIGGMVNTDASGQGSLKYGKTSAHVLALKAVLMDGSVIETGPLSGDALAEKLAQNDLEGQIYQTVLAVAKGRRADIEATFPQLNRFLTGYDLKHVYDPVSDGLDLTRILCGAEGTLAFITEILLDLTPIPTYRGLVNIKYDSFESALRNAPLMVQADALSVETVDSKVLNLAREDIVWHSVKDQLADVPGKEMMGINIVEFAGENVQEQQQKMQALVAQLDDLMAQQTAGIIGYQTTDDLVSIGAIYNMRKKAVGLLGNAKGRQKPIAFTEDTAVPPEHLADYIMEFRALLDAHQLQYGMFGHVDAGVLHVRPALDMCDPQQEVVLRQISDQVVKLTAKYGGLMWGEHGRGFRSEYGPEFFGGLFNELRRIKGAFDPQNRLNPGKICTPIDSTDELVSVDATKRGAYDRQIPVQIRDSYKEALDCNGNGLCFTFDTTSPMCPSYKLSGDRRESPKGRAGLMREWLRQLELQGVHVLTEEAAIEHGVFHWKALVDKVKATLARHRGEYDFSHEVMDAMQSCLACKACTSQCPIKVDVPSFRSRFIQLYHQRYLRPIKDYFVATVESYAPLMAKMPGTVNAVLKQRWMQKMAERTIGMVDVPLLSQPTLKQHLRDHPQAWRFNLEELENLSEAARQRVVLVVQDPFTSFYDATVVKDLVLLIEKLGYRPILLPFKPNGKPQHIKGFLRAFAKTAADSAQFLNRLSRLNVPMVGPDPAMVLCYRDEYVRALGDARGDFKVLLPQEWLMQIFDTIPAHAPRPEQNYYILGHCTEKTEIPRSFGDWKTIFARTGASLGDISVGCCGMAGTYGHDAKHLEDSRQIYASSWQPALEKLPVSHVLVTGYSCRSQVKRFDGATLRHPIQALLQLI